MDANKRQTYRFDDQLQLLVTHATARPSDESVIESLDKIPKQFLNLSAGGASFFYPTELPLQHRLFLAFLLSTSDIIVTCEATVLRCEAAMDLAGNACFRIAVAYCDLSEEADQYIMQHIFKREIELRNDE